MSRLATWTIFVSCLLALLATPVRGQEMRLDLDPEQTAIAFTLGATLHTVEGSASLEEGTVRFDPASGAAAGQIVVAARRVETGNEGRDKKMRAQVLEVDRFPRIVFSPTGFAGDFQPGGSSKIEVEGFLEIHGDRHEITAEVELRAEGDTLRGTCTFRVPYVEWGMKDPSNLVLRVDKHVDVTVEAVGRLSPVGGESGPVDDG